MAKRHEDLTIPEGTSPTQAFVQILDPATGTGTFLVEVIDLIHNTMAAKWKSQGHGEKKVQRLWNEYVPKHLLPRLHGYEFLMAPVCHRAPQDRAQALRDRLPLRQRRAGPGVPDERARAAGRRAAHPRLSAGAGARSRSSRRDQARASLYGGDRKSTVLEAIAEQGGVDRWTNGTIQDDHRSLVRSSGRHSPTTM